MRKSPGYAVLFAFIALVCFTPSLRAQDAAGPTAGRAAITKVLADQEVAWNRGDIDAFLTGYWRSPELTFSGNTGISHGWEDVLARYKRNYPDRAAMGKLDFSNLEFHFIGEHAAVVLGKWRLTREKGDVGGVFSLVWQRFPEGWRIVHDHTSVVASEK